MSNSRRFNSLPREVRHRYWSEAQQRHRALKKYGFTRERYEALLNQMSCEICGSTRKLVFDHNHKTGKGRGRVCNRCNRTVIPAVESGLLDKARAYLKKYGEV